MKGLDVIDRLAGQMANSTSRRDRFTVTRQEVEALIALKRQLVTGQQVVRNTVEELNA